MSVEQAIENRWSVRNYAPRSIEPEKLNRILKAGWLAPTASNQQYNKIIAVTDPAIRQRLVPACEGQSFVGQAPCVLVVCANHDRTMICGQSARSMDGAIAMSFMYLQAVEEGLQGCWLGWFQPNEIRRILNIPKEYVVVAVMPIGYPAHPGSRSYKRPMEEVVSLNEF